MSNSRGERLLERGLRELHRLEDGFLALLLGVMIVLAPAQIVLRNFFDADISWGDPLLRLLVLWVGLLGALVASRADRHIGIDVFSRVLSKRGGSGVRAFTSLFTAGVSAVVAYHAGRFVLSEYEFGSTAFGAAPAWACAAVIPFAFGLIAVRHALRCAQQSRELLRAEEPPA